MGAPGKKAGGRGKVYASGAIVPSKCRPKKAKAGQTKMRGGGDPHPLPQKPGFLMQDANGVEFLLNDYPVAGGPWAPAWSPAANGGSGGFVWINEG